MTDVRVGVMRDGCARTGVIWSPWPDLGQPDLRSGLWALGQASLLYLVLSHDGPAMALPGYPPCTHPGYTVLPVLTREWSGPAATGTKGCYGLKMDLA